VTSSLQALCSNQQQLEADDVGKSEGEQRCVDTNDCVSQSVDMMTSQEQTGARLLDVDREKLRERELPLNHQMARLNTADSQQVSVSLVV